MIIRFEEQRSWNEATGTVEWARHEGRGIIDEEIEAADGDEVVGDRLYEGTPGQAHRARLMDLLFNSPTSGAQHRQD